VLRTDHKHTPQEELSPTTPWSINAPETTAPPPKPNCEKCPLQNHVLKLIAMNTTSGAPCDLFMIV